MAITYNLTELDLTDPKTKAIDQLRALQPKLIHIIGELATCADEPVKIGDEVYDRMGAIKTLSDMLTKIEDICNKREAATARGGPSLAPGCYGIKGAY